MSDPAPAPEVSVSAAHVEAVLKKYEHDIIGKAHFIFNEIKALISKARSAAEAVTSQAESDQ
jgi:hypothetical protein